MGKSPFDYTISLTPEQRAAAVEQARVLRQLGERLGLNKLRNPELAARIRARTAPPEPTLQRKTRKRAAGGGAKRKISDDQIEHGKAIARRELDRDPLWASLSEAFCEDIRGRLKLRCHWQTIETWIVKPVLKERGLRRTRMERPIEK